MTFRVMMPGFSQDFDSWVAALEVANSLKPKLKSWFKEIRILEDDEVVWIYGKTHAHPQYIGPGTYNRLARRFMAETLALEAEAAGVDPTEFEAAENEEDASTLD
jgi:dihydropteroate synthase